MTDLEQKIKEAAQAYYSTGKSDLSDEEFDTLVEELRTENPNSEVLNKVGWGYSADNDTTSGEKCKHKYGTAGSLGKARN
jgi:NAD-dependent DNA ligase